MLTEHEKFILSMDSKQKERYKELMQEIEDNIDK
jgi:hypothetical protein